MSLARSCSEQGSATAPSRHAPSIANTHSGRAPISVMTTSPRPTPSRARPPPPRPARSATSRERVAAHRAVRRRPPAAPRRAAARGRGARPRRAVKLKLPVARADATAASDELRLPPCGRVATVESRGSSGGCAGTGAQYGAASRLRRCRCLVLPRLGARRPAGGDRPRRRQPLLGSGRRGPVPLRPGGRHLRARWRADSVPADAAGRLLAGGNVAKALANAGAAGGTNRSICPTANLAAFNAIRSRPSGTARSSSGRSIDAISTADSAALIARKDDIATFFNQGGGIFAFAGDSNGDDPADPYYQFVPIGIGGKQVASPFRLTPEGQALGLPGLGERDRDQRRHQLLPDAQLLPGAAGRQRAAGRRARLERAARAGDAVCRRHHQRRHDRQQADLRQGGRAAVEPASARAGGSSGSASASPAASRSRRRSCS